MKRILLLAIAVSLCAVSFGQDKEKEAIRAVVNKAYVGGLQNMGEIADIRDGFHPGFNLLILDGRTNQLNKLPIYNWIASTEARKAQNPGGPEVLTTAQFPMIDITGVAAVAKVELYREGKKIFTDYLSLYQFKEGWRIVSKIYHRH